jgi:hypothetical protein
MKKLLLNNIRISSLKKNHNNFSKASFSLKRFCSINYAMKNIQIPSVTIVRNEEHAKKVLKILLENKSRFHAWDTETINIDIKEQSPVLFGNVICLSCFIGPDIDFGNGPSKRI